VIYDRVFGLFKFMADAACKSRAIRGDFSQLRQPRQGGKAARRQGGNRGKATKWQAACLLVCLREDQWGCGVGSAIGGAANGRV